MHTCRTQQKHKNMQICANFVQILKITLKILKIIGRKYISIISYPGHFSKNNNLQYQTKLNTEVSNYRFPFYTKVCCAIHLVFAIIPLFFVFLHTFTFLTQITVTPTLKSIFSFFHFICIAWLYF